MSTTAAVVLIVARNTHTLLRILPTKRLSRPKKNGSGMTKADPKPWDVPGGKLKDGETPEQAMKRELREETGLTLDTATKISESHIPDCKCAVFVYEVDKELPAKPLDGVSEVAWVPIENTSHEAHFRLERALHVTTDILTRYKHIGCRFCIHCKRTYMPKYTTLEDAQANEEEGSIYAEQHLSGICSDECWDAAFKPDDY
jgi:8-oxo-dGTP pyrophosphatase MutT (NUDIX family)